jgi:hypothetical protein
MEEKMRIRNRVQTKSINSAGIESGVLQDREKQKQRPQRLLLLRCLLEGGSLAFGEWAEEEEPQGPKLVSKRLSSGCDRFVGVTCQKNREQQNKTKNNKKKLVSATLFGENKKE